MKNTKERMPFKLRLKNLKYKIKLFFKYRLFPKKEYIKSLEYRRDEVISRAKHFANRTFPDHLLEEPMANMIKWVVEPHIQDHYDVYNPVPDTDDRGAERAVMKIMELREKIEKKGLNEGTNDS